MRLSIIDLANLKIMFISWRNKIYHKCKKFSANCKIRYSSVVFCLFYNYLLLQFDSFKNLLDKLVKIFQNPLQHQNVWIFFKNNFWNIWINICSWNLFKGQQWKQQNYVWYLTNVQKYIYNPAENFSFFLVTIFAKTLHLRCSTGFQNTYIS